MASETQQLNVEIDAKVLGDLEDLKRRTKVSKRALVEQAIRIVKNGVDFQSLCDSTLTNPLL